VPAQAAEKNASRDEPLFHCRHFRAAIALEGGRQSCRKKSRRRRPHVGHSPRSLALKNFLITRDHFHLLRRHQAASSKVSLARRFDPLTSSELTGSFLQQPRFFGDAMLRSLSNELLYFITVAMRRLAVFKRLSMTPVLIRAMQRG
jgi:hypothetical protein